MNETLRRALLRARLSEEDIAARLEVDPKTVRRWLEGRVPYLRHRWALVGILGMDEADLWPQVGAARAARSWPEEIQAIYPNLDAVPREVWRSLFDSATREIDILDDTDLFLAKKPDIMVVLADSARSGVRVRICVRDPSAPAVRGSAADADDALVDRVGKALTQHELLLKTHGPEIRLHSETQYNSIYRADDQLLVSQHAYGIPVGMAAVIHLRQARSGEIVTAYLESFERIWTDAQSAPAPRGPA